MKKRTRIGFDNNTSCAALGFPFGGLFSLFPIPATVLASEEVAHMAALRLPPQAGRVGRPLEAAVTLRPTKVHGTM